MKVNLNTPLLSIMGDQAIDEERKPLQLKTIVVNSLMNQTQGESGERMLEKFNLAQRIFDSPDEVELKENERELILKAVNLVGITLAYGRLHYLFKEK